MQGIFVSKDHRQVGFVPETKQSGPVLSKTLLGTAAIFAMIWIFSNFCVAGLRLFGTRKEAASAFALLAFVVLTVPLFRAGFFAVAQSGMSLRQFRDEIRQWRLFH